MWRYGQTANVHGVTMAEADALVDNPAWRTNGKLRRGIVKAARRNRILPAFLAVHACLIQKHDMTAKSVMDHAKRLDDYVKQLRVEWNDLLQRSIFALATAELGAKIMKQALQNAKIHLETGGGQGNFKHWVVTKGYLYGATDEKSRSRNTIENVHFILGLVGRVADDFPDDVSPAETA
jgi:hypothetical protein